MKAGYKWHSADPGRYYFDRFEIDPHERLVAFDGKAIQLQAKVFDLLIAFLENPGRLLTKDELLDKVWNGDFVEEGNIARNVSTLRKSLGDTGKEHRYIVTVPGHGYRFIPDVTTHSDCKFTGANSTDSEELKNILSEGKSPRALVDTGTFERLYSRPVLLWAMVACLVIGVLVAFSLSKRRLTLSDTLSFEHLKQTAVTQDGNVFGGFISPDGKYLAYTRIVGHDRSLSLRQISTGSVLELRPPDSNVTYWAVAFSPNDEFLYYIINENDAESGSVFRIPLIGQQLPTKIADRANGGLTISPDGRWAAFTRTDRQEAHEYIVIVSTTGENERVLSSTDIDSNYHSLDWSPDGQSLLYSKRDRTVNSEGWYLAEIPSNGGPEIKIGNVVSDPILGAKWLSDKSGLIVNAIDSVTHKPQIFTMSYPDGALRRVTQDMNSYIGFSVTADGKTIVVPQINSNRQIWRIKDSPPEANQISTGTEKHFDNVAWIDDENIIFDEDESGSFQSYNIYSMRSDGSNIRQLTLGPGSNSNPAVSSDGRTIAFVSNRSGTRQIWKMDADGRNASQLTFLPNDVLEAAFLADGDRILFSDFNMGKVAIWTMSVDGGEPKLIVRPDIDLWALSPKGDRLAFVTSDAHTRSKVTHVRRIGSDADEQLLDISPETWLAWGADGTSLYYDMVSDNALNIWKTTLAQPHALPVTEFKDEQVFRFAWSPSGKVLACIRHQTTYDALIMHFE